MRPLVYRVWQHAPRDWHFEVRYAGTESHAATTGRRTNRKDARSAALACIAASHRRDAAKWGHGRRTMRPHALRPTPTHVVLKWECAGVLIEISVLPEDVDVERAKVELYLRSAQIDPTQTITFSTARFVALT